MHTNRLRNYSFPKKKVRIRVAFRSYIDIQLQKTSLTCRTPIDRTPVWHSTSKPIFWELILISALSSGSLGWCKDTWSKSSPQQPDREIRMWLGSVLKLMFLSISHKYQPHAYRARHHTAISRSLLLCSSFPHASHWSRQDIKSFETLNLLTTETGFQ